MKNALLALCAGAALGAASSTYATEGGGSIYPVGTENYNCCSLPPPGLYGMVFGQHYFTDQARGNDGSVVSAQGFRVPATAVAPRLVWVAPTNFAGASVAGLHAIVPIVDLKVTAAPGVSQSKSGMGNPVLGSFIAWHRSDSLHAVAGLDVYAPTGRYRAGGIANIGRNHWVQPDVGSSLINPRGFNADAKVMWT